MTLIKSILSATLLAGIIGICSIVPAPHASAQSLLGVTPESPVNVWYVVQNPTTRQYIVANNTPFGNYGDAIGKGYLNVFGPSTYAACQAYLRSIRR